MKEHESEVIPFSILLVVIFIFIVLLSISLIYDKDSYLCETNPSVWCYDDWICANESPSSPGYYPAKNTANIAKECTPNSSGKVDEKCNNAWPSLSS